MHDVGIMRVRIEPLRMSKLRLINRIDSIGYRMSKLRLINRIDSIGYMLPARLVATVF